MGKWLIRDNCCVLIIGVISISRSALDYASFAVWKPRLRAPNVAALTQVCNLTLTITLFVSFVPFVVPSPSVFSVHSVVHPPCPPPN